MEYEDFLKKQNSIYKKFKCTDLSLEGISPREDMLKGFGSYLIAFRHPSHITEPLARFSERIASEIPSVTYGPENAHTTISDYDLDENFIPDKDILEKFEIAANSIKGEEAPRIYFASWMANTNTVIIEGQPTEQFLNLSKKVINEAGKQGIELRLPWGAHLTAARFTEPRNPKELKDFHKLMKEAPILGTSKPTSIGIYNQSLDSEDHTLDFYSVLELA